MDPLLERFLRYAQVDTQSSDSSTTCPSTPGQLQLGRMLVQELRAIGLSDATQGPRGTVVATLEGNVAAAPVIAWLAHIDTSPEASGANVHPIIHRVYDGKAITLPGDSTQVVDPAESPELLHHVGKTIITSDGTTLLGGDDKAGVAIIVQAVAELASRPEIPRGTIKVVFTCDEEVGNDEPPVDVDSLGALVGYTVDGGGLGEIEGETFSGDRATVTIRGVATHPGMGKRKLINAVRLVGLFLARLPRTSMSPETTEGREGFIHPTSVEGSVAKAQIHLILRDFVTGKLKDQLDLLRMIAASIQAEYPGATVEVAVDKQYRNMAEGIDKEPRAMAHVLQAMRAVGVHPRVVAIRGGTDGANLTERGMPTPNLFAGMHDVHSLVEWACLEEMQAAVRVLMELASVWSASR
jgi:tripeptide aminopeptidase